MTTRRDFVRRALLAASAASIPGVLAACGKDEKPRTTKPPQGPSLAALATERLRAGATSGLEVYPAGGDFAIGITNYVGLGLVKKSAGPIPGGVAQVWMAPSPDPKAAVQPLGPFSAPWQGYTVQTAGPPGVNAADLTFDRPGVWTLLVENLAGGAALLGNTQLTVQAKPLSKGPGDRALPSQTPTVDNKRGVDPICTRRPQCPMHEITLAQALANKKPTIFLVGTPAFCESRTCGPNLEELLLVRKAIGDRVNYIHVEVFKDDKEAPAKQIVTPTFKEWGFQSEPWVYLIDTVGVIRNRYEGPTVAPRIQRDLAPLLR